MASVAKYYNPNTDTWDPLAVAGVSREVADVTYADKTTTEAALSVGDPGDIKATNAAGTSITNVKPGRIDARVRGLSTSASWSANQAILLPLAVEAATEGKELWIPDGVYKTWLRFSGCPHLRVNGTGTLQYHTDAVAPTILFADNADDVEDVTIEGITLDGNGSSVNIVQFNTNPVVSNTVFRNVRFTDTTNWAIGGTGAENVTLDHCHFEGVLSASYVWNAGGWKVLSCTVENSSQNAFFFPINVNTSLGNFQFIGNTGSDIGRMMLELWDDSGATGYFDSPMIRDNFFTQKTVVTETDNYGYSVVAARNAHLIDNTAICLDSDTAGGYGFEITTTDGVVRGNRAYGFVSGYVVNIASNATLSENLAEACYTGFEWANANAGMVGVVADKNIARNCRDQGFYVKRQSSGICGGHILRENRIVRDASWSGDAARTFMALKFEGMDVPCQVIGNVIEQGMTAPTLSGFQGMELHSEDDANHFKGTQVKDNIFIDRKTGGGGMTPIVSPGDAAETNITPTGNWLYANGAASAANTWA